MFPRFKYMTFMNSLLAVVVAYPAIILSFLFIVIPTYIALNLFTTFVGFVTFNPTVIFVSLQAQKKALLGFKDSFFFKIENMLIIGGLNYVDQNAETLVFSEHAQALVFVRFIDPTVGATLAMAPHCITSWDRDEPFLLVIRTNNRNLDKRMSKVSIRSIKGELKEKNLELIGVRHIKTGEFYSMG